MASALSLILMGVVSLAYLGCGALAEDRAGMMGGAPSTILAAPMRRRSTASSSCRSPCSSCSRSRGTLFPIPPFNGPSLRWYEAVLADPRLTDGARQFAPRRVHLARPPLVLGFLAAWGFARFHLLPRVLRGLITLPLTVSYLIIGMGLLIFFNGLGVPKSLTAAGIGHVVINLPLCFAIIYSQMGEHQANIERAARDLGAQEWQVLALVTAPDAVAGALRQLLPVDDLLLGRVRHRLPAHALRYDAAGRDLEPAALRAQPQDQCGGLAGLRRLHRACHHRVRTRGLPEARNDRSRLGSKMLRHRFGRRGARRCSLAIAPGGYTVLLGPSGSGKTTLLSILGGFVVPTSGPRADQWRRLHPAGARARPTATVFRITPCFRT